MTATLAPTGARRAQLVMAVLIGAQFMISMDATIVNVALPSIREQLGFSDVTLSWVVNGYALPFGGLLLLGARLGDRLGAQRVFRSGTVLFAAASLWCGLAGGPMELVLARAAQGVGAAVMSPVAMTLLVAQFDGPARHRALGWWGAMSGLAGGIGMLLGGALTTASWRWNFFINVPIAVVILLLSRRYTGDRRIPAVGRPDVLGALLSTTGLLLVAYAVISTERLGWTTWSTSGLLGAALLLLACFTLWEARVRDPLVPLRVFTFRSVSAGNTVIALVGAIGQITYFTVTLYLQQVLGYTPLQSGAVFLPISVTLFVVSTAVPRLIDRLGLAGALGGGLVIAAGGLVWLAAHPPQGSYARDVLGPTVIWAVGWGIAQAASFVAGAHGVESDLAGVASGLIATTYRLGGAIGLAAMITLAAARTEHLGAAESQTRALAGGITYAWWAGAGCGLVAAAVAVLLRRPAPAPAESTSAP
ncbi:MFS transporter [Nocardia aurantiaca]|uniref:MFS transporter n=1 Tax=Nocardia aurantiaca TaxID=2675850 RepID=A0A6I3L623_9NOCA|nr:MFS transporter [Nocardia aurantiaca]MTE16390.1 MFS transporter [Nocardia aurantiaca]